MEMRSIAADLVVLVTFCMMARVFAIRNIPTNDCAAQRPNILLITTDQQRTDTIRAYGGNNNAVSPSLDRLASQGVLFADAVTAAPQCRPARQSWLTGVHTPFHGVIDKDEKYAENPLPAYPDLLKEVGYHTVHIGKCHFDPIPNTYDLRFPMDKWAPFSKPLKKEDLHDWEYLDTVLVNRTMKFLRKNPPTPWMIHLSLVSPHSPVTPPLEWAGLYDNVSLPKVNYRKSEELELPSQARETNQATRDKTYSGKNERKLDQARRAYYALTAYIDNQVGRLMEFLDEQKISDSALVIFTSDHGNNNGDHGLLGKGNFFDSSWKVPLIMRWPGHLPAGATRTHASGVDVTATITAIACVPEDRTAHMSGFNLIPFEGASSRQLENRSVGVGSFKQGYALLTDRFKFVYYPLQSEGLLFDRVRDPLEQNNLYAKEDFKDLSERLRQAVVKWLSSQQYTSDFRPGLATTHRGEVALQETVLDAARMYGA